MITAEMEVETGIGVDEDDSDYEYEYPPELLEEWARGFENMKLKIARGELKPQTVGESAAKHGVILD